MTACCGANHQKCDWFQVENQVVVFPEYDINPGNRFDITGRERGVVSFQDIRAIDDSAVSCDFETPPKFSDIAKYISLATDYKYSQKVLLQVGERQTNVKRLISCNLGITREDDKLPQIVLEVLDHGATEGVKLDLEENLKTYYKLRGWDWSTGRPTEEKLTELGIIGDGQVVDQKELIKMSDEDRQEMERRKAKYIPLLRAHSIASEDMHEYLGFISLFSQSDEDFQDQMGEISDVIQLAIKDQPPENWFWLELDYGKFSSGIGKRDDATLVLTFRNQKAHDGVMLNPVTAVLSNRLKVKPIGKVRIFQNYIGLYLDKFDLKF
ncbi:MAG: aldehyde ferredoxin oxidoreductase C-terminal domain-containing protein, partial [Candidatus Heimdallarchaeota archaeon]